MTRKLREPKDGKGSAKRIVQPGGKGRTARVSEKAAGNVLSDADRVDDLDALLDSGRSDAFE